MILWGLRLQTEFLPKKCYLKNPALPDFLVKRTLGRGVLNGDTSSPIRHNTQRRREIHSFLCCRSGWATSTRFSESGVIIPGLPTCAATVGMMLHRLWLPSRPDILGISQFTHNRFESLRLAKMAKEANPACFVVFGGPHATHRSHEILSRYPAVDAVVLG